MQDETGHEQDESVGDIAVLGVVAVPGLPAWNVRMSIPHADGAVAGWAPYVFWSSDAGEEWLAARRDQTVRPAVRDCTGSGVDLAYAAVVDDRGEELLVSEPLDRVKAAGVAARFAAGFRSR